MTEGPDDPDRYLLNTGIAYWAGDPDETMTEAELDRVLAYFALSPKAGDPKLRSSIQMQFQEFIVNARDEGFRERDGEFKKVAKPSTIVQGEMQELLKAGSAFYDTLARLDPASKRWLDRQIEEMGAKDSNGEIIRFRDLEAQIYSQFELLFGVSRYAEGMAKHGPSNMALKMMIKGMFGCWEICHGELPISDKGRGRRDDPFLRLCQEIAGIAHAKLQEKGGGLRSLKLVGIVDDVVKERRARAKKELGEK